MRIDPSNVCEYLIGRGLLSEAAEVTVLSGGVSSTTLAVGDLVVKQPLDDFDVPDAWHVKPERVLVEADALRLAADVLDVPEVVDLDAEDFVLVMSRGPAGSWKDDLLQGRADDAVARSLGEDLRRWHDATADTPGFDDPEIFGQQRVDPYYETLIERRPELEEHVRPLLDSMLATTTCLAHGDWSPKNVQVGEGRVCVIDWEITHRGDPVFDLAFMTNHLALKQIHGAADTLRCAQAFWDGYGAEPDAYVTGHLGALMCARVDGKSPAEYLTEAGRARARLAGVRLLTDPPDGLPNIWRILE